MTFRKQTSLLAIAGVTASTVVAVSIGTASAQSTRIFEKLAGSWSGAGTVTVMNGASERIRCRADYRPRSDLQLHLDLTCASDSFKMQVVSEIARSGNAISGTWRETSFGVSGPVSGSIGADRVSAVVQGMGLSARLSLVVRGNSQSVTLASEGQIAGTASVTMRRH